MADAASSTTGISAPSLSSISSGLQSGLTGLYSTIMDKFNQYFPAEKRKQWTEWLTKFATEKPYLASFLLSQIALSGPPLALFIIMTITVVIFALIVGLLVGLLGAVVFIVFAVGFALMCILPVLFFTTAAAVFVWLWGVGTYYIVKWFNEKEVPGIHTDLAGGLKEASGINDLPGMSNGESMGEENPKGESEAPEEKKETPPQKQKGPEHKEEESHGKSTGAQHHSDGKENSSNAHPRKLASKTESPKEGTNGATGHADGAKKKVPA